MKRLHGTSPGETLASIVGRSPVVVGESASLRSALHLMDKERVGSVVVVEGADRPLGIVTLQDVLRRVALPGADLEWPVTEVMSRDIQCLPGSAGTYEAVLLMSRRRFRHLPVVDEQGRLIGVVSRNQLNDPLGGRVDHLTRRIGEARDAVQLAELAPEIRAIALDLVGRDAGAGLLTRVLSGLNDLLTERVIAIVEARHRLPPASWAWIAFGSEGRYEQTFATDQDNGIIFSAAGEAEAKALRGLFAGFARDVNDALDRCGFPLCPGNVMAGNEKWCLSLEEWRQRFSSWIRTPEPEALLNATIFFDFRTLHGDAVLADTLAAHLRELAPGAGAFLHMLAANALAAAPPLGVFRDFAPEDDALGRVDLKKFGSRIFVDAARVYGLAAGSRAAGTVARLRDAGPAMQISSGDVEASVQAFHHLQRIRLSHQHACLAGGRPADNLVDPEQLNPLDRRVLVESLKQARRLQVCLKQTFRLEG
ncbi:MAG: CBS domain-containing protein [Rhodocyclaceae bacterium]|nr:CBS domain-containing protein [Rhodocyclaceae bacterium]